MSPLTLAHKGLLLDACCTINLYASDRMADILMRVPVAVAIATYVRDNEATRVGGRRTAQGIGPDEPIDLQPLIDSGLLATVDLGSPAEANSFVNFAAVIDDGEAVTGAIALHRNWAIATDDGRASRFFAQTAPHLRLVSTPELIKHWADNTQPTPDILREVLQNVRVRARFAPSMRHPFYAWWRANE